jgi:hypothetical protein
VVNEVAEPFEEFTGLRRITGAVIDTVLVWFIGFARKLASTEGDNGRTAMPTLILGLDWYLRKAKGEQHCGERRYTEVLAGPQRGRMLERRGRSERAFCADE